jgi:flagellar biosynthetic protein FliP
VNLQIGNGNERQNLSTAIQIVLVMTLLTLAPSLIMLMTSFTRIVIVLGFVRTALGVPSAPANQLLIGISLFITFFIMTPVWNEIQEKAITPYMAEQINSNEAMDLAIEPLRTFMLRQTRPGEVDWMKPTTSIVGLANWSCLARSAALTSAARSLLSARDLRSIVLWM